MSASTTSAPPRRRGGNRLPVGHPARGRTHAYERRRSLGPDPERRDRYQRERTRRAITLAGARGELSPHLALVIRVLLDMSDDRLSTGWWSLAYIARQVLGDTGYGDDPASGARSAGGWMHDLKALGWLDWQNRWRLGPGGCVIGTSNLWRIKIPDNLRHELQDAEDAARRRAAKKPHATRKAPQNRHEDGSAGTTTIAAQRRIYDRNAAISAGRACETCRGDGYIDVPGAGAVTRCPSCHTTGLAPGPAP